MIVERFLGWLRTAPASRRADAARMIARAYLQSSLSSDERDELDATMTALLDDRDLAVRRALADVLAPEADAPGHLILALSLDEPEIAAIIVEHSSQLLATELAERIRCGPETVRQAVARRTRLSDDLVTALTDFSEPATCQILLANHGASFSKEALVRLIDRHGNDAALRGDLLARNDLPIDLRQALLTLHARAMKDLAKRHGIVGAERVERLVDDARDKATIALAFQGPIDEMPALATCLMDSGQLTPGFLLRTVACGQIALFCICLSALSNVPSDRVSTLLSSGNESAVSALLNEAGLPRETLPVFVAAIHLIWRSDDPANSVSPYKQATNLIDAIIEQYQAGHAEISQDILGLLRSLALDAKRDAARSYMAQLLPAA